MDTKASLKLDLDKISLTIAEFNVNIKAGLFSSNAQGHFKSVVAELEKLEGALISQIATFDLDDSINKITREGVLSILINHGVQYIKLNSTQALKGYLRTLVLDETIDEIELILVLSGE